MWEVTQRRSGETGDGISVALAYPHPLIAEGIANILRQAGFRVVGRVKTFEALQQMVADYAPDIVLFDWQLPDGATRAIEALTKISPNTSVVVLTLPETADTFLAAMQAGAKGYLSVNLSPTDLVDALRMIAKGDVVVSREMAGHLTQGLALERQEKPALDALSERQREVLSMVARGATNREIADMLIITENTVKVHLRNILDKLNLRNRQQAAAYAVQEGLLENLQSEKA